jgi:hypothetical protein
MTVPTLEERVAAVEAEIGRLKSHSEELPTEQPSWEEIRGTFKDDAIYEEAMRLGREYRKSLRPKDECLK